VCRADALTYKEREEVAKLDEMEIGLEPLVEKYGMRKVMDTVARMSKKG